MLTHNAPRFVEITIRSIREFTHGVRYELVVVDNASEEPTTSLLRRLKAEGAITQLELSPVNTLFSRGNNIAASLADPTADYFLLLNSDVRVKSDEWLTNLLAVHKPGMTAYGMMSDPARVDGYCVLMDANLYREAGLDEFHQWWWSVAKRQAALLRDGYCVQGYVEHERWLHHYGGRSGVVAGASGQDVARNEMLSWFDDRAATVLDRASLSRRRQVRVLGRRVCRKLERLLERCRPRS